MKLKRRSFKCAALALIFTSPVISSCGKEEEQVTIQDTADISETTVTNAYFQDLNDMAGVPIEAPSDTEYSSGRTSGTIMFQDHRFKCNAILPQSI